MLFMTLCSIQCRRTVRNARRAPISSDLPGSPGGTRRKAAQADHPVPSFDFAFRNPRPSALSSGQNLPPFARLPGNLSNQRCQMLDFRRSIKSPLFSVTSVTSCLKYFGLLFRLPDPFSVEQPADPFASEDRPRPAHSPTSVHERSASVHERSTFFGGAPHLNHAFALLSISLRLLCAVNPSNERCQMLDFRCSIKSLLLSATSVTSCLKYFGLLFRIPDPFPVEQLDTRSPLIQSGWLYLEAKNFSRQNVDTRSRTPTHSTDALWIRLPLSPTANFAAQPDVSACNNQL